jgi:hypothetical protein
MAPAIGSDPLEDSEPWRGIGLVLGPSSKATKARFGTRICLPIRLP